MQSALLLLLAEALLLQPLSALHIGKSSPCYDACDGDDLTVTQDLSCIDAAYDEDTGTGAGKRMRECLACTERSDYANSSDTATDQYWFMFHLKYTQQFCLFDNSDTQISNCGVECSPLENVLTTLWGDTTPPRFLYDYCDASSGVYVNFAPDCASCLKNRTGTVVVGNFMETMQAACDTKPNITTDSSAFFDIKAANGDLFDTQTESATGQSAPTATNSGATVPSDAASSTNTGSADEEGQSDSSSGSSSSNSDSNSVSSSSSDDDSGLSTGAAVGIGVGVTVAGIAAIVGIVFFILRRRRAARNARGYQNAPGGSSDDKAGFMAGSNGAYAPYGGQQMPQSQGSPYGGAPEYGQQQGQWSAAPGSMKAPIEMSAQSGSAVSEMPAGRNMVAAELPGETHGGRR